ncbi:MAG: hypothetical protein H0T42_31545 [Deltaproteobacteria bacterium]|nr:hypothetical protein [Deltaproteobacteria bacterium]
MSRIALHLVGLVGLVAPVSGCFYAEPINQRPSITIEGEPTEAVHRGDHLELFARSEDPDGHYVQYQWRAYACNEPLGEDGCDQYPFADGLNQTFEIDVPIRLSDDATPVSLLRVVLAAKDELGATSRPEEELLLPVVNRAPTLELDRSSRHGFVTATPIEVYAKIGDADDGPAAVMPLTWVVFGPAGGDTTAIVELAIGQDPLDPKHLQFAKTFTPNIPGEWTIEVTATDPLDGQTTASTMITVAVDGPPCLAQVVPIVATGGAALPITEPTLFRVSVVIDDLDLYPPQLNDPFLGTTRFAWSVKAPGQPAHLAISGAVGNSFAVDPASYTPGDIIEVRAEIFDRTNDVLQCPNTDPTCSVISQPTCIQRQTWRVEVR